MHPLTFAALGHVTHDVLASGLQPGGAVLYSTLAAAALGARATAFTRCADGFVGRRSLEDAGVRFEAQPGTATSTFENLYRDGHREERLLARGEPLEPVRVEADVVFAGPVIGELDLSRIDARARVFGAGLQGWLRTTDGEGRIRRSGLDDVRPFARCQAVFLSEHDVAPGDDLVSRLVGVCELVVVTLGRAGARVYLRGVPHRVQALPTKEVDPTGAGDVFAAAFLLALAKGATPLDAAVEATCAASFVIEAPGASAVSRLIELPQRLARYRREVAPPTRE